MQYMDTLIYTVLLYCLNYEDIFNVKCLSVFATIINNESLSLYKLKMLILFCENRAMHYLLV